MQHRLKEVFVLTKLIIALLIELHGRYVKAKPFWYNILILIQVLLHQHVHLWGLKSYAMLNQYLEPGPPWVIKWNATTHLHNCNIDMFTHRDICSGDYHSVTQRFSVYQHPEVLKLLHIKKNKNLIHIPAGVGLSHSFKVLLKALNPKHLSNLSCNVFNIWIRPVCCYMTYRDPWCAF